MKCLAFSMVTLGLLFSSVSSAAPIDPGSVSGLTLWLQSDKINGTNSAGNPAHGAAVPTWGDASTPAYNIYMAFVVKRTYR